VPAHLLIANPTAQSGKNRERIEAARRLLDAEGLPHDFLATAPAGGTVVLVAEALARVAYTTVIYMGGDGTFAEVAKGILRAGRGSTVALGMLPTGTANDQGQSFGLSSAPDALGDNVRVVREARQTWLDAGRLRAFDVGGVLVREDLFFDSAGWGLSPRVLRLRNEDREAIAAIPVLRDVYRDQLVYAGALLRTFLASYVEDDKFDVRLEADGRVTRWTGLCDLIVKATPVYGGMWIFDEAGRHDDGLFEVVPFAGKRDWASKAIIHLRSSGLDLESLEKVGLRHSRAERAARITLHFSQAVGATPLAAQIDGEEFPHTPRVEIDVLPRALRLLVPAAHATAMDHVT
jgi:diacylglycerol kinase family enzyme